MPGGGHSYRLQCHVRCREFSGDPPCRPVAGLDRGPSLLVWSEMSMTDTTDRKVYVAITGLKLKRPWHIVRFYWHALPSFRQAKKARGNLRSEARTINGVRHTLTVWESEAVMCEFLYAGPHKKAMRAFASIASGKAIGFEADRAPSWDEAHDLWCRRGRDIA